MKTNLSAPQKYTHLQNERNGPLSKEFASTTTPVDLWFGSVLQKIIRIFVELDYPKLKSHWGREVEKQGQQTVAQLPLQEKKTNPLFLFA